MTSHVPAAEQVALLARGAADVHTTEELHERIAASLKTGVLSGIIAQSPALEGALGVEYAYDAVTGQTSLIKKSVSLNNHSINSTNVNQKSTQVFFYSATVHTDGVKA